MTLTSFCRLCGHNSLCLQHLESSRIDGLYSAYLTKAIGDAQIGEIPVSAVFDPDLEVDNIATPHQVGGLSPPA